MARALGVSSQAISHWEREGYPDITLLPAIANYFGVTIDALMGNDKKTANQEFLEWWEKVKRMNWEGASPDERLAFVLPYYRKYHHEHFYPLEVLSTIESILKEDFSRREEMLALLREAADRLMDTSNRHIAVGAMAQFVNEEELDKWLPLVPLTEQKKVLKKRYGIWNQPDKRKWVEAVERYDQICELFDEVIRNQDTHCALNRMLLGLLDGLREENVLPDGWCWLYATTSLLLAGGLFAADEEQEGWEKLRQAMELYERWNSFDADAKLQLGSRALFNGLMLTKCEGYLTQSENVHVEIRDGTIYVHNSNELGEHDIQENFFHCSTLRMGEELLRNHPAFASVREDERLIRALEWLESNDSR